MPYSLPRRHGGHPGRDMVMLALAGSYAVVLLAAQC